MKIENIRIDLDAIRTLSHCYRPTECKATGCCCSRYEVEIGKREMAMIVDYLPLAAKHATTLQASDGTWESPLEEEPGGRWTIDTDDDGRCAFAYTNRAGETRCSLHTAALEVGADPFRVKPRSCALWPLALSEGRHKVLTVMPDAFEFPCNRKRSIRSKTLDPGVAEIIKHQFGERFLHAINHSL